MSQLIAQNDFRIVEGRPVTSSRIVAKYFNKRHDAVMRDIENLVAKKPELNQFHNFVEMVETIEIGSGAKREAKVWMMDRKGFCILAMGFTGAKALDFKCEFYDEYDRMEKMLYQCPAPSQDKTLSPAEQFSIRNAVGKKAKKSPSTYRFIYSLLKQRFQVARYSQISTYDFREALNFIKELKLPAPYSSESLPAPAPIPAEYNAEDQSYKLTISRRELERFGTFIYNWRYQFHDAVVLYVNHLVAVKSPYSRKLYDATFDSSLQQLEELFREHGISIGPDLPNPERLRTLAYSI
jgi:Rha family phage regulatory protein